MKKVDLKTGMLVKIKNGKYLKVTRDNVINKTTATVLEGSNNGVMSWDSINEDLSTNSGNIYNIVKVFSPKSMSKIFSFDPKDHNLIWEKVEVVEMTLEEVCKELGKDIKIVQNKKEK